jgi:hypothetical protein
VVHPFPIGLILPVVKKIRGVVTVNPFLKKRQQSRAGDRIDILSTPHGFKIRAVGAIEPDRSGLLGLAPRYLAALPVHLQQIGRLFPGGVPSGF